MKRALVVALVAVAAATTVADAALEAEGGQLREVSMPGKVFVPGTIDVLVGDTVQWRNGDVLNHTVTARDDSFDSGFLPPGEIFSRTFASTGTFSYTCTIHRFMQGVVRVVALALSGPPESTLAGGRVILRGLARADLPSVALERREAGQWTTARTASPTPDGSFVVRLRPAEPLLLRARAGRDVSLPIRVSVAPRVRLQSGAGAVVATASPSRAGARAALQAYDRDHFAWRTIARSRVGSASTVRFPLPAERPDRVRVVVRGGAGWADGASPAVVLAR